MIVDLSEIVPGFVCLSRTIYQQKMVMAQEEMHAGSSKKYLLLRVYRYRSRIPAWYCRTISPARCSWSLALLERSTGQHADGRFLTMAWGSGSQPLLCPPNASLLIIRFGWIFGFLKEEAVNLWTFKLQAWQILSWNHCRHRSSPPKWNPIKKALFEPPAWGFSNQSRDDLHDIITEENRRLF